MTLCIAAECKKRATHHVIITSDFESETPTAAAEIQDKLVFINTTWPVLIAGTMNRAVELVDTFGHCLRRKPITKMTMHDDMKRPVRVYKRKLDDELVGARFGMTYSEFLRRDPTFPDDIYRETTYAIERLTLECSLIVVLFFEGAPYLFRVHDDGLVEFCEHFCAIGSGLTIAEASLFHREHESTDPIKWGMYNVYEAMRLGSRAPG